MECIVKDVKTGIEKVLVENSFVTSSDDLQCFNSCYENTNPFTGLETEYRQKKFYKNHFNLVVSIIIIIVHVHSHMAVHVHSHMAVHVHSHMAVHVHSHNILQEPVTVKLGDSGDVRESGVDTFQYVPLLPGLSSLLQNPYVFEEVYIHV